MARSFGNYSVDVRSGPAEDVAVWTFGGAPQPRKLLVTKLDHVGDFFIALPALQKLRRAFLHDHITLVCAPWNADVARSAKIADEVAVYEFFPEKTGGWNRKPIEDLRRFREVCSGRFDIALDLRVDEDTRFLLRHVDASLRCGIGARVRHPYLDIILPGEFEHRGTETPEPGSLFLDPGRFNSRMPVRTPFFHETDFSVTDTHLVYGPSLPLPAGRFRASWGLQLSSRLPLFGGALRVSVDVARGEEAEIVEVKSVVPPRAAAPVATTAIEFTNPDAGATYEFRIHAGGRPRGARLRFFGIKLETLDVFVPSARLKRAELHIGEKLCLLVQLIEDRVRRSTRSALGFGSAIAALPAGAALPPTERRRVVIAPLSNKSARDWGLDNYARLVAALLDRDDGEIILVGTPGQRQPLEAIVAENGRDARIINLAGRTDWAQVTEVIRNADLVIANNSGVAHLAAACGTPILAIYSGTHQPQEWGPRGDKARALSALVACSPCGFDETESCPHSYVCMKLITPEIVADEAIAMLSAARLPVAASPM